MEAINQKNLGPLNIWLMDFDEFIKTRKCGQVTSTFIHEPSSTSYAKEGLFSEEIFGTIGTPQRFVQFGWIDLNCNVLAPWIYQNVIALKRWYGEVMSGREYAKWDPEIKELVHASATEEGADTGYAFFLKYFPLIQWKKNNSLKHNDKVEVIEKYKDKAIINKFLVLPAGPRDMRDTDGRLEKDSINSLYISLLTSCRAMPKGMTDDPIYDVIHYSVQKKLMDVFNYLMNIVNDKGGFLQRKLGHRHVQGSCRDVITATSFECADPSSPQYHKCDETKIPLFLVAKGYASLMVYHIRSFFYSNVMTADQESVPLINPQNFKLEYVPVDKKDKEFITTEEGIQKTIDRFADVDFRLRPMIAKSGGVPYYLYLVYDTGKEIYVFRNIQEFQQRLGDRYDEKKVRPLTYAEMFYICAYLITQKRHCLIIRYPIADEQNIYPSKHHVITTDPGRIVELVAEDGSKTVLPEYPTITAASWGDAIMVHNTKLRGLGADHDGNCLTGDTRVYVRARPAWFENIKQLNYAVSGQKIDELIKDILTDSITKDGIVYAQTRLDKLPQAGEYNLDRNGAKVYQVLSGIEVLSIHNNRAHWSPFNSITVEDDCEYCTIQVGRHHTANISTNESVAVFDEETGGLKKVTPVEACGKRIPIIKSSPVPFGDYGTFDDGWFIGAFVSDGYLSQGYVGYSKLDDDTRNNFARIFQDKIPGLKYNQYRGVPNEHKLAVSVALHFTDKRAVEHFTNMADSLYVGTTHNALTKTISKKLIDSGSREFLYGMIAGLLDGDGSVVETRNGFGFRFSTSSRSLADSIIYIGKKLGIRAGLTVMPPRGWSKETYVVTYVLGDMPPHLPFIKCTCKNNQEIINKILNDQYRMTRCGMSDKLPITKQERAELADLALEMGEMNDVLCFKYENCSNRERLARYVPFIKPESSLYSRVTNLDVYWETCRIISEPKKATVYDLLVPDTKVFAVNDGLIVYDTVGYHPINTDEANAEIAEELNKLPNYILPSGEPVAGIDDMCKITMLAMTRDVPDLH